MVTTCPRCSKSLADAAGEAAFCMFCGLRLVDGGGIGSAGSGPDAGATVAFAPTGADTRPEPAAEPQLTRVGRYRLVRFLGAGGMGQVYEAEDEEAGRRVAVKLLSGRLASNPQSVERFRQEGRVASQISHPNCVFVLGADALPEAGGRPFIVMELMPGRTLKDVVDERGPLPVGEAVAAALDVCDGLAAAHRHGVIHRDVKPSNCFVAADGRVKVGDFGLSKSLDAGGDGAVTGSGTFLGTVLYASPEQIRGEPVGYESDVYAVCGTLYTLLAGRAPYQHDSLTAALAKAVSEPAPSVRARRPDVPRELDRIIRRGLDRDRANRFASLDDLGDALRALQPERAVPARRRLLGLAYLLDAIAVNVLLVPLELVRYAVLHRPGADFAINLLDQTWLSLLLTGVYFTLFEGLAGTTPGKNLLGLRVQRPGHPGPPGLRPALVRTGVFNLLWFALLALPEVLAEHLPAAAGVPLAVLAFAGCAALLLRQLRGGPLGWRGVHDFAAGTQTVQRPRPAERVKLHGRHPDPLGRPARGPGLPAAVGGFAVTGKLLDLPDGGEAWAAEDRGLGRRLVVRVCPAGADGPDAADAPRPYRLRTVGVGDLADGRGWVATAAPTGAPLTDLADPGRPVGWAEARGVLEQVAEVAADDPGVRLDQVWVEPTGRVQVADVPLPTGSRRSGSADRHPLRLLREAATALLEGAPRAGGGPVRAPLPPHAGRLLGRLFAADAAPDRFAADLRETASLPPQVTAGMRAAQLGVQAALLSLGLLFLYLGGFYSLIAAAASAAQAGSPDHVRAVLADPAGRAEVADRVRRLPPGRRDVDRAAVLDRLADDRAADTLAGLDRLAALRREQAAAVRAPLNRAERVVLNKVERVQYGPAPTAAEVSLRRVGEAVAEAGRVDDLPTLADERRRLFDILAGLTLLVPVGWAAFAVLFRGGLAMRLGGLVPVRADGRPAGRLRCGVRELLVWAPVVALLLGGLWVQYAAPGLVALRTGLWLLAVLLLPAYVLVALRDPARPPHDRLLGTRLVPA